MTYDLKKLHQATETILVEIATHKADYDYEAINWGDLHCCSAEEWKNQWGDTGYRVWIEEVSPDASDFRQGVHKGLIAHGFSDVEVITEW